MDKMGAAIIQRFHCLVPLTSIPLEEIWIISVMSFGHGVFGALLVSLGGGPWRLTIFDLKHTLLSLVMQSYVALA